MQMDARVQSLAGGQFLEIQEVSPLDSGQYSCVATNIAGSSSLVFLVSVHGQCVSVCVRVSLVKTIFTI